MHPQFVVQATESSSLLSFSACVGALTCNWQCPKLLRFAGPQAAVAMTVTMDRLQVAAAVVEIIVNIAQYCAVAAAGRAGAREGI